MKPYPVKVLSGKLLKEIIYEEKTYFCAALFLAAVADTFACTN